MTNLTQSIVLDGEAWTAGEHAVHHAAAPASAPVDHRLHIFGTVAFVLLFLVLLMLDYRRRRSTFTASQP